MKLLPIIPQKELTSFIQEIQSQTSSQNSTRTPSDYSNDSFCDNDQQRYMKITYEQLFSLFQERNEREY